MDPQLKEELGRLYTHLNSATASTHFYNEVYKYISFINKSTFISELLEKDNEEWHKYDLERRSTRPAQQDGESETSLFLKEMRHMRSGDRQFLSYFFLIINRDIFDLIDWYRKDGFYSDECNIMLNGRKKKTILERILPKGRLPHLNTDFNVIYIDNMPLWKNFIAEFHKLLISKIGSYSTQVQQPVKKEVILELSVNGHFKYLDNVGTLKPKRKEYILLCRLASKKGKIVTYKEIARHIYSKSDSIPLRMTINDLARKLKKQLEKVSPKDFSNMIKNQRGFGYYLDLKENQDVLISP